MLRRTIFGKGKTESISLYDGAYEIFSFRRLTLNAVYAFRAQRAADGAETEVFLPPNMGDFITNNSLVSTGGTLGDFLNVGNGSGYIMEWYGQKGVHNALTVGAKFTLNYDVNGRYAFYQLAGLYIFKIENMIDWSVDTDFSFSMVYSNNNIGYRNQPGGFGNANDGTNPYFAIAGDHRIKVPNGAIGTTDGAYSGAKIFTAIKNGNEYSGFLNGVNHITPANLGTTDPSPHWYFAVDRSSQYISECIMFKSDITSKAIAVQAEQNKAFNNIY